MRSTRNVLLLFFLLVLACLGQLTTANSGPVSTVFNFSVDIKGDPDPRGIVGDAGYQDAKFYAINVPPGMKLHITHVTGDMVAWITGNPAEHGKAGVLWGLKPNVPDASEHWTTPGASDVTFVYVQGALSSYEDVIRIPVDQKVDVYLSSDQVLVSRLSAWMNTTGEPIHMETTFKLTYELVPVGSRLTASAGPIWSPWWWRL